MITVCMASYALRFITGGAYMWMFLNWALGIRANGCRVIWLESVLPETPLASLRSDIDILVSILSDFGLADSIILVAQDGTPIQTQHPTLPLEAALDADILLNLGYDLAPSFIRRFKKTAFVDIDPGLTQLWMSEGSLSIANHDIYFTYGENVGAGNTMIPDCGIEWHYTPPPVYLPEWPVCTAPGNAAYTTVSSWWDSDAWIPSDGTYVDNSKRSAFLEYLDLPARSGAKIELAIPIADAAQDWQDRVLFEKHQWSIRRAVEVSASPESYRRYVQQSRGEFSCMRRGYSLLRTAWTGERSINYLASGKPVLLQDTGTSRFIPSDLGFLRFGNPAEAAHQYREIEKDYQRHCLGARRIAEEFFDARLVIRNFLGRALA